MAQHQFTPDHYHVTIGWHEPVLRIADGDSVTTTTVDARGFDEKGEHVTERGNPMTGPFFIEGAEEGDALEVVFDRLTPNRRGGFTSSRVAAVVTEPGYIPVFEEEDGRVDWVVDLEDGYAQPEGEKGALANLKLPLLPMVGCFGVAPPRGQFISTATSGTHGGNMDYNGFVEGVSVYLPVSAPGALFHIGDGHALQGDGEIVGNGVEISFEVTFTVHLKKRMRIGWPRATNETHIMTFGNARPLDQCMQHATTEMIRWLHDDLGLDNRSVHALLGQAVEYDLGNMFDPAYTMVCKISKKVLEGVGLKVGG